MESASGEITQFQLFKALCSTQSTIDCKKKLISEVDVSHEV